MEPQSIQLIMQFVIFLAIVIVGIIQHKKIKDQKETLQNIKIFFDIFKIDEVRNYVSLIQDKFKLESEKKEKEIRSQLENTLHLIVKDTSEQITQLYLLGFDLLIRIPPKLRRQIIEKDLKGILKETFLEQIIEYQDVYIQPNLEPSGLLNRLLQQKTDLKFNQESNL